MKKMKKLSILFFVLVSFSCSSQQIKCSEFRTGEFRYSDPSMVAYTIKRTDSLQIEKNLETNVEVHSSVQWKSECEYELTYVKITNVNRDVSDIIGKKIKVEITSTDGDFYEAHAQSDAIDTYLQFEKVSQ